MIKYVSSNEIHVYGSSFRPLFSRGAASVCTLVDVALGHVVRNASLVREVESVCGTCHVQIIISGAWEARLYHDSARCALNSKGFFPRLVRWCFLLPWRVR